MLARFHVGDSHGGVGLAGMRERVHSRVVASKSSSEGDGTAVVVTVPVAEAPSASAPARAPLSSPAWRTRARLRQELGTTGTRIPRSSWYWSAVGR